MPTKKIAATYTIRWNHAHRLPRSNSSSHPLIVETSYHFSARATHAARYFASAGFAAAIAW